jgi:two-component system sensor histidine kinase PhoQ
MSATSIHARLLIASLLILPLFLGVTAMVLDRAFANYQLQSQQESMRLQQLLLARAADWDGRQWQFQGLDDPRYQAPRSGLYGLVMSPAGELLWRSASAELMPGAPDSVTATAAALAPLLGVAIGETRFEECRLGPLYYCHATGVAWGSEGPQSVFLIIESRQPELAARSSYRQYLLWLSLATATLLLVAQTLVFRWGLSPLRGLARAIAVLERGEADKLDDNYPAELAPLTTNLNLLLASETRRRERVRNTMDRLTHVLKSPLMLIRNSRDQGDVFRQLVDEQVTRMLGIVEGELARARLDGRAVDIIGKPVPVRPVLERISSAYSRLPRRNADPRLQGPVTIDLDQVSGAALFYGEERDLQDLFGSILENSLKYCRNHIEVAATMLDDATGAYLELSIADDGQGIAAGLEQAILRRGARADSASLGQGLGLAIVVEIVSAYGGSLHTQSSSRGGAMFVVRLPVKPTPANVTAAQ